MADSISKDAVSVPAIRELFQQDWFEPETLKKYIESLRQISQLSPRPPAVLIDGRRVDTAIIEHDLLRFFETLPPAYRRIDALDLSNPEHLTVLEDLLTAVAGLAPTPPTANIPKNLEELVKIHEASLETQAAQAKPGTDLHAIFARRRDQQAFIAELHQIRNAAISQLSWAAERSDYLTDLAQSLGVPREHVVRIAKERIAEVVDQTITVQAFRQAQLLVNDPNQLATFFTKHIGDILKQEGDIAFTALETNKKDKEKALKEIEKTVKEETTKAKSAAEHVAADIREHPAHEDVAEKLAVKAIEVAETGTFARPVLLPQQRIRLAVELAKHPDETEAQQHLATRVFPKISGEQQEQFIKEVAPAIRVLGTSSSNPSLLEIAHPTGIIAQVRLHPTWFPSPFVKKVQQAWFSAPERVANIISTARSLNISLDAVVLHLGGVDAGKLAADLSKGKPGFLRLQTAKALPTNHPLISKLRAIAPEQGKISEARQAARSGPSPLSLSLHRWFEPIADGTRHAVDFGRFLRTVNPLPAIRFSIGRIGPIGRIGQAVGSFFSILRVRSPIVNSVATGFGRIGQGFRSFITLPLRPLRAVGGWVSSGWKTAKTWAGAKIRSGLAKAGAWLAKKGVAKLAAKLGGALLAKGTAALIAQAAPIIGQVIGALTILSMVGDIGKFLWDQRKNVAKAGFALLAAGGLLFAKLLMWLGSSALSLGLAALGGTIGGMIAGATGAFIGSTIGWTIGSLISAGKLGSLFSSIGSALGSTAAWAGNLLGALTAPGLMAGMGGVLSAVGLGGVATGLTITLFFVNPTIYSALFVPGVTRDGSGIVVGPGIGPPMDNEVPLDPNCIHAACRIQRALEGCNIRAVTSQNAAEAKICLSGFQPLTQDIIYNSAYHLTYLQCVGFKYAAESESGVGFFPQNALMYLQNRPSNCKPVTDLSTVQVGDNAVWGPGSRCPTTDINQANSLCNSNGSCCGHIAAITRVGEGVDIDVTQAWGDSGIVNTVRTSKSAPAMIMHCTP